MTRFEPREDTAHTALLGITRTSRVTIRRVYLTVDASGKRRSKWPIASSPEEGSPVTKSKKEAMF